ncbi:hypothetical protein B6R96_36400 (plasmid) [Streptomyces sp. Sge12]|uniref:hypothetical protein n=1 Tax=Streptomyces sp. Sge12 TaxID=1972846 RepID=UPI0009C3BA52|nr:hypothetical protein [Streptomyces sp. Sge12]ARE79496.1 hypothetical protein B6R96_36400 [Streptomyces sp. Sge12]
MDAAAAEADVHADTLQSHPEWQKIQTLRGALRHVLDVMKEKAGSRYWDTLRADVHFQGFWRTASIRACEAIAVQAATLAHRLRADDRGAPSAALLKLSAAAVTYSAVASAEPKPEPTASKETKAEAPLAVHHRIDRREPTPYATRDDAVRAAHEVAVRFQSWIQTPMGQEAVGSSHKRVQAFRAAWMKLPSDGAQTGPAVGSYGEVAEHAQALVALAVRSARFAPTDVQALQDLAKASGAHSARLSVTLPPGPPKPALTAAAPMPRVATPAAAPTTRTPRASA